MFSFKNLSVSQRIGALVIIGAVTTAIVGFFGVMSMSYIGKELTEIAEEDIPLTEILQKVTVHQLEQSILTERVIGETYRTDADNAEIIAKILKDFDKIGKKVDTEIKDAIKIAEHGVAHVP